MKSGALKNVELVMKNIAEEALKGLDEESHNPEILNLRRLIYQNGCREKTVALMEKTAVMLAKELVAVIREIALHHGRGSKEITAYIEAMLQNIVIQNQGIKNMICSHIIKTLCTEINSPEDIQNEKILIALKASFLNPSRGIYESPVYSFVGILNQQLERRRHRFHSLTGYRECIESINEVIVENTLRERLDGNQNGIKQKVNMAVSKICSRLGKVTVHRVKT